MQIRRFWVTVLVFGLWAPTLLWAQHPHAKIAIISPPQHHSIVHRIEAALYTSAPKHPNVIWVDPKKLEEYHLMDNCDCNAGLQLVIAIGPSATRAMLKSNLNVPVLSVLIHKDIFEGILCEHDISMETGKRMLSAIYLDQPFSRAIQLADALIPTHQKQRRVGMILGPSSSLELQRYQAEANLAGVSLKAVISGSHDNPVNALNHVLSESDVLLALPDAEVFNPQTARGILLTAYRKKVPIIGYSQTYVKMGALASLYLTPKQISTQIIKTTLDYLKSPERGLPAPQFASNFSVMVNSHVAQLLKRDTLSELQLRAHIERHAPSEDFSSGGLS